MFTFRLLTATKEAEAENGANGNGAGKSVVREDKDNHEKHHFPVSNRKKLIVDEVGKEVFDFIDRYVDITNSNNLFISTTTRFNILNQERDQYNSLVNLKRINDIRRINKFFEAVNSMLPEDGLFIGNVETYSLRKKRILKKFPPVLNWMYYTFDFIVKRVFPKLKPTQKLYFFLTRGNNRVISKAESLGRLYSCGFELKKETVINGQMYFVARKIGKPAFDYNPTYGPLIKLKRVGKGGKMIGVYKMRTMHAYSEYLQAYVYKKNKLKSGGKFDGDFRITTLGRLMRKFWIDELPMLINWVRRDMKLVGVRPLSNHFYNLYDEDLKQKRIKHLPGLIPPYYADLPKTLDEIQESERKYLEAYEKKPLCTDWKYFWKAMWNILIKKARSE